MRARASAAERSLLHAHLPLHDRVSAATLARRVCALLLPFAIAAAIGLDIEDDDDAAARGGGGGGAPVMLAPDGCGLTLVQYEDLDTHTSATGFSTKTKLLTTARKGAPPTPTHTSTPRVA